MNAIDRDKTIKDLEQFRDRFIGCRMRDWDEGFVEGMNYCIRYIKKFAPEVEPGTQIAFTFGGEEDE